MELSKLQKTLILITSGLPKLAREELAKEHEILQALKALVGLGISPADTDGWHFANIPLVGWVKWRRLSEDGVAYTSLWKNDREVMRLGYTKPGVAPTLLPIGQLTHLMRHDIEERMKSPCGELIAG